MAFITAKKFELLIKSLNSKFSPKKCFVNKTKIMKIVKCYERFGRQTTIIQGVIDCVRKLVQIPSLSGEEKEIALFIKDVLGEFGLDKVYTDEFGDVIGFVKGKSSKPLVVLEGHMDHVSPGNTAQWKCQPYAAEVIDDKLFGRGTVDMKAALAAMIFAAKEFSRKEHEGTLAVCFVVHEETVEGTAIGHIIEEEFKEAPDLIVIGEPSNLNLGVGHRGRAVIETVLCGRTAHASMPELGLNALYAASDLVSYVEGKLSPRLPFHKKLGKATITTISLRASPQNVPQLPDKAEVLFDRRMILGETEDDVVEPVEQKVEGLRNEGRILDGTTSILEEDLRCWTGRKFRAKNFFPAWLIQENDIVQKTLKAIRDGGLDAKPHIWKFSTDGVCTYGLKRIPTVGFGPGDETLAHQPDEHVRVKDVERAVQAYVALAERFT